CGEGMRVFRGAHHHGIKGMGSLVKQFAKVGELLSGGEFLARLGQCLLVDIAQGHDVLAGHLPQIVPTPPAAANDRDVQLLIRILRPQESRCSQGQGRSRSSGTQEASARELSGSSHARIPWLSSRYRRDSPYGDFTVKL